VLTVEEQAACDALREEMDRLCAGHEANGDMSDEVDARLGEIETALEALQNRPMRYDPAEVARAGAFVSLDGSGALRIERGYVRPEDEPASEPEVSLQGGGCATTTVAGSGLVDPVVQRAVITIGSDPEPEEDDGIKPLPERLLTELTAHRTLALRETLANDPEAAFLSVLHALALKAFYRFGVHSCLEIEAKSATLGTQAPGLNDPASAKAISTSGRRCAREKRAHPSSITERPPRPGGTR